MNGMVSDVYHQEICVAEQTTRAEENVTGAWHRAVLAVGVRLSHRSRGKSKRGSGSDDCFEACSSRVFCGV